MDSSHLPPPAAAAADGGGASNPAGERAIPSISYLSRERSTKSTLQPPSRDPNNPIRTLLFTHLAGQQPVAPPLRETPENPIHLVTQLAREGSTGSPARSEDAPEIMIPLATQLAREGSMRPPALSQLHRTAPESPITHRIPLVKQLEGSMSSPARSPLRETAPESLIPHRIPLAREGSIVSPVRSPLREAAPESLPLAGEGSIGSPARSPLRETAPESPIPLVTHLAREGSVGSQARSPHHRETSPESLIRIPLAREGSIVSPARSHHTETASEAREGSTGSPARSPLRETGGGSSDRLAVPVATKIASHNLIPHRSPSVTQLSGEGYLGSPLPETAAVSPNRLALVPVSFLVASSPKDAPDKPLPPAGNRVVKEEMKVMRKSEGDSSGLLDRSEVASGSGRRMVVLGLRVLGIVLSLISFSVMVADRTVGWAGDSFDRYVEYRYLVSVNVIAFVYSGFQAYSHLHHMITNRYLIRRPLRHYFDFSMDQVLAYLLMSVSSSAASRNDGWVLMFGSDEFTIMANASISMSFLAFITLALSSLVSAYYLFRRTT